MAPPVAVYGGGGFGREVAWLAEQCGRVVSCFVDDGADEGRQINGIRVISLKSLIAEGSDLEVVLGVGDPRVRERLVRVIEREGLGFAELVHPRVERSRWVSWGHGAVICAGSILTTGITLGAHVQINIDCTIGHDARLADFATLAPGVHLSGWVFVGARAYLGTGAVVVNGTEEQPLVIGDDAVIGAGACVTQSIPAGVVAVGVPAKPRR
jgi:sugar O-acyltransferase (sialic acid O-acetyltransferase NeuD family)